MLEREARWAGPDHPAPKTRDHDHELRSLRRPPPVATCLNPSGVRSGRLFRSWAAECKYGTVARSSLAWSVARWQGLVGWLASPIVLWGGCAMEQWEGRRAPDGAME